MRRGIQRPLRGGPSGTPLPKGPGDHRAATSPYFRTDFNVDAGLPTTFNMALTVAVLPSCPDGHSLVFCLACHGIIALHQPASESPDRMFGVCEHCLRWHLFECRAIGNALMVLLPESEEFWMASRGGNWLTNGQ